MEEEQRQKSWLHGVIKIVAVIIALSFLFTVTGRGLSYFFSTPWELLEMSRSLEEDPLVEELKQSVVFLNTRGPGGTQHSGTGFNLHPEGLIVTNRHVIEEAMFVGVSFVAEGNYSAVQWNKGKEADIALVRLEGEVSGLPYVEMSSEQPEPDDEVLVIGNPMQHRRVAMEGSVVEISHGRMIIDAPVYPGHSGSPVFNPDGEVVGVLYASRETANGQTVGLAVSLNELGNFLQRVEP